MNRKAVIFGIKGYRLTKNEKCLFRKEKPWGVILFERNIKNILQLKLLIDDIKKILNDKKYPVLILAYLITIFYPNFRFILSKPIYLASDVALVSIKK